MENKNNNKRTYRLGILLLLFTLLSTVMLPGTFAKYTSEYAGSDTALVAKWDIDITDGDKSIIVGETLNLDLFSHNFNKNILSSAGSEKIVAPGVDGSFKLEVNNASDVAAKISYTLEKTSGSADVPMEFSIDDGKNWLSLEELNASLNTPVNIAGVGSGTVEKTVGWKWAFEGNDANDTALGVASAETSRTNYALNVKVTATQVMPTE